MKLSDACRMIAAAALFAANAWGQAGVPETTKTMGEAAFSKAAADGIESAKGQQVPAVGSPVAAAKQQSPIDLHTHSYCSDGKMTPEALVQRAVDAGIVYWALTDHDTLACLERAKRAALAAGLKFVAGIEMSAEDDSVHILGLGIDPNFSEWKGYVEKAQKGRVVRARKIIDALNQLPDPKKANTQLKLDFKRDILLPRLNLERKADGEELISEDQAESLTEEQILAQIRGQLTRPDIAAALIKKGYVQNPPEAFDNYIGNNKPGDIPMDGLSFQDAIDLIHRAGGKAILAHPYTIINYKFKKPPVKYHGKEYADFNALSKSLIESGLDGFETIRPNSKPEDTKTVEDSIKASGTGRDMLMSVGSDYHGYANREIGPPDIGGVAVTQQQKQALITGLGLEP